MKVKIYTDGACAGNPGPGGWAAVFVPSKVCDWINISGYDTATTNNVMELTAVLRAMKKIIAIENLNEIDADYYIHSDSGYVINAINNRWYKKWSINGWKTTKGESVKNRELWEQFIEYKAQLKAFKATVNFVKVKGHNGDKYNEQADVLACAARDKAKELI